MTSEISDTYGTNHRVEDVLQFDPQTAFREYPYFEEKRLTDTYPITLFEADYSGTQREYQYKQVIVKDHTNRRYFIVAEEQLGPIERARLARYCRCAHCKTVWPFKFLKIPKYCGCLHTGRNYQIVINETRKYLNKRGDPHAARN